MALIVEMTKIQGGVPFYIGKVIEFGQGRWTAKMKVVWYWPAIKHGAQEEGGSDRGRYANYMEAKWEPPGERPIWIDKEEPHIHVWMFFSEDKVARLEV